MMEAINQSIATGDRVISLGPGLAAIPEKLLLAHARGEVLFITGAGISQPSGLPDFRGLVIEVYKHLDQAVYGVLASNPENADLSALDNKQQAEVKRFNRQEYDVVLGMLERRMEGQSHGKSRLRQAIGAGLRRTGVKPNRLHRALMRLADRGGVTTIVTTNFDLLLEDASKRFRPAAQTYSLGGIPRPARRADFAGVLHIHGAFDRDAARTSDVIVTDQDFGEFYLRRRIVSDFIYDAARLFNLVLVGYSANDPPMRYLLSAVAADGTRFEDLRERFVFVGDLRSVVLEDWKGRGITPIAYDSANGHSVLVSTLERWAALSANNGKRELIDAEITRIVRKRRSAAAEEDRDIFDHIIRRSDHNERLRVAQLASKRKADLTWFDALNEISENESPR